MQPNLGKHQVICCIFIDIGVDETARELLDRLGLDPDKYALLTPGQDSIFDLDKCPFSHFRGGEKLYILERCICF